MSNNIKYKPVTIDPNKNKHHVIGYIQIPKDKPQDTFKKLGDGVGVSFYVGMSDQTPGGDWINDRVKIIAFGAMGKALLDPDVQNDLRIASDFNNPDRKLFIFSGGFVLEKDPNSTYKGAGRIPMWTPDGGVARAQQTLKAWNMAELVKED